jgi:hypothetical protein
MSGVKEMSLTSLKRARASRRFVAPLCLSLATFLCVVVTADACSWDYTIWIPRDGNADALYRFIRDGKAGYIDPTGKVVIEPKFEPYGNGGGVFHDGLVETGVASGKYADATGKLLDFGLEHGWDFSDGLAASLDEGTNKWGYIDPTGKFAISPRFEGYPNGYVASFYEGRAWVKVEKKYGFIDHSGAFVIEPAFTHAENFHDGMARVVVEGPCAFTGDGPCPNFQVLGAQNAGDAGAGPCKFTFVDARGALMEGRFDAARDFSEGLAPVRKGEKWGYVDKSGRLVVEPRFDDAEPFSDGLARVSVGELFGYIDKRGTLVIPARFKDADDFSDGLAPVTERDEDDNDGFYYYIDRQGATAIKGPFRVASRFFKGLAHVELKPLKKKGETYDLLVRRFAYIDAKGKTIFSYEVKDDS